MRHSECLSWKFILFGILFLVGSFMSNAVFAKSGARVLLSKPRVQLEGENVYRWGDTIDLRYEFGSKSENFNTRISLEGCGLNFYPDPEQRSANFSIPLRAGALPNDQGHIRWVDYDKDGFLRGEITIEALIRNEDEEIIDRKEIVKEIFWVDHPATPLPDAIQVPDGPVFEQGDKMKVIVTTPVDDWNTEAENSEPEYQLLFLRPSLKLPGGMVTTEQFGVPAKLAQGHRVEKEIDLNLSPGPYEIWLMRDIFVLDKKLITVTPLLPTISFEQKPVDGNSSAIPVTISVSGFPEGGEDRRDKYEPFIGIYIDDGYSEYPSKAYPFGYLDGKWSPGEDWEVHVEGFAGETITTYIAYPYTTNRKAIYTNSFDWDAEPVEVAKYTIEPDANCSKPPVVDPSWEDFSRQRLFTAGEKFSIKFGDVNEMGQYDIDHLRPFAVVIRKNKSWKSSEGEKVDSNDIEIMRFEVRPENLTLKGTMPDEPGDYLFTIESNGYVPGNFGPPLRYEDLNMNPGELDTAPVEIYEGRDYDPGAGGFDDASESAFEEEEEEEKEKPIIVMSSFVFSILGEEPPGFGIEIHGGDTVPAESNTFIKVSLPQRMLSGPLYLRILQVGGVSSSGSVYGKSHVMDKYLWYPPTGEYHRERPYTYTVTDLPALEQDIRIGWLGVPGDYEASIIMPPHYDDRYIIPTTTTILRHRFEVAGPSLEIGEIILNEKQNQIEAAVDIGPEKGIVKKGLSLRIARSPRLTLGGAICFANPEVDPVKFDVLKYEYDANTVNFKKYFSSLSGTYEIQLVYRMECFLGECPEVILDSKWVTGPEDKEDRLAPSKLLARAPEDPGIDLPERRFPDLIPVDGPVVAVKEKGDSNVMDQELTTYEAPPTLTLSSGYYPLDANENEKLHLGFRLTNRSHKAAKGITLKVKVFDEYLGDSPADWVSGGGFVPDEDGAFGCYVESLEPNEGFDFFLSGSPPATGALIWAAQWEAETEFIGERMATGRIKTGNSAKIFDVIVLADQKQELVSGVHAYPYPFGLVDDGLISTITLKPKYRRLFVVGKNILRNESKLKWNSATSDDSALTYHIRGFPRNKKIWGEDYERAWLRYTEDKSSSAGNSGLEGLIVYADFEEGILPGAKKLRLSGSEGTWDLRFGGLKADIMFVREVTEGQYEPVDTAYLPETVHIAVIPNVKLPITEILIDLHTSKKGYGKKETRTLTARLEPQSDEAIYVTGPILLSEKNKPALTLPSSGDEEELMLDVIGGELGDAVALAEVNAPFAEMTFAVPTNPPQAKMTLARSPSKEIISYLWKDALKRAAACNKKIKVYDWDELEATEAEEIWNLIVFTKKDHYLSKKVRFGHQAAMILLRDMFQVMTKQEIEILKGIQADDKAVRGFMKYMSDFWLDDTFPVNRMEVDGFDGEKTTFSVAAYDNDEFQAKEIFSTATKKVTAEQVAAWRLKAGKQALGKLQEAAAKSIEDANEAGDCEIEDLLKITGFGFDAVEQKLMPKLMKLREEKTAKGGKRLYWVPDMAARDWVANVSGLAEAVKRQQQKSSADTDIVLTAAAVLTMPLMFSENAIVVLTVFAIDLLDLAVTSYSEISQYTASQWEQEFSEGASITIGIERNKQAIKDAKGWMSTTFGIGMSGLGAAGGVFDVMRALPKVALARKVAKGRKLARGLEVGGVGKLSEPDMENFLIFAFDSKAKAFTKTADTLSATQRRAIELLEASATDPSVISALKNSPDASAMAHASDVARVQVDPGSGKPMIPKENKIKLKKPEPLGKTRGPPKTETPPTDVTKTDVDTPTTKTAKTDADTPPAKKVAKTNAETPPTETKIRIDKAILSAKAGVDVTDPRPFGMMQEAMRHFQETVNKFMLRVRVRAANVSSLQWMHKAHPPKHVKLKSKTINDLDVELGARSGSQGMVGYFKPKRPKNYDTLSALKDPPDIVKRYKQRLQEYYDNWKDIERLKQKGLISVDEGVVVDRGLSSTRLDPKTDKLKYIGGPKKGTGKGFTGDYDMWDITHPDGSKIITDPKNPKYHDPVEVNARKQRAALLEELGSGPAQTQHGPHKDWIPDNDRDRGIDAKIRDSHRGVRDTDGTIGPRLDADGKPSAEALLEFYPGKQPKVSYEFDSPKITRDLSKTDSASKLVSFTDAGGKVRYISIGARLGRPGSTSVVYEHGDHPYTRVVRVITKKLDDPAVKLDEFGRMVLDKKIVSAYIRAAKEYGRWDISDVSKKYSRVIILQKVTPIVTAMRSTGKVMTEEQQEAFENAMRDLNEQGYVWLNNTWDNFGFVKGKNGKLMVVVLDTGGIVKITGSIETAKRTARRMQLYVNGPLSKFYPSAGRLPVVGRIGIREAEIKENFMKLVDIKAMGIDDVSQIKFTPSSGEQFDYIGPSFSSN